MQYQYALIVIDMMGNAANGYPVSDTTIPTGISQINSMWPVNRDYDCLVDSGFVIDLRPLLDTPNSTASVAFKPSGKLDNGELMYLDDLTSTYAYQLLEILKGNTITITAPVPIDALWLRGGSSSSMFYALAWASHGALIGMRHGNNINWSDGTVTAIPAPVTQ